MDIAGRSFLVTGGAGFIGSHLAERLLAESARVRVVDDLSNGDRDWVPAAAEFVRTDLTEPEAVAEVVTPDLDGVFHLAARKDVNDPRPREQFESNLAMTHNVLECMTDAGVRALGYTSSSTVYGEAPRPTPETHAPLEPISVYGAGKLAEEALVSVYAHTRDVAAWTFRFANVVGPRLQPGAVIVDFIHKLEASPSRLEILGDGRQEKSYLHVTDCVDAMCHIVQESAGPLTTVNLGTDSTTSVTDIADIVAEEMELSPSYDFTGGDRGWTGDVPRMRLSIEKAERLGWHPTLESDQAVRRATREILSERAE